MWSTDGDGAVIMSSSLSDPIESQVCHSQIIGEKGKASTATALDQKQQQQRNIVIYDHRMACQLWEDSLEVGVMLCQVDHSWYLLHSKGLYTPSQTQEQILHNLMMGGEKVHTSCCMH